MPYTSRVNHALTRPEPLSASLPGPLPMIIRVQEEEDDDEEKDAGSAMEVDQEGEDLIVADVDTPIYDGLLTKVGRRYRSVGRCLAGGGGGEEEGARVGEQRQAGWHLLLHLTSRLPSSMSRASSRRWSAPPRGLVWCESWCHARPPSATPSTRPESPS